MTKQKEYQNTIKKIKRSIKRVNLIEDQELRELTIKILKEGLAIYKLMYNEAQKKRI